MGEFVMQKRLGPVQVPPKGRERFKLLSVKRVGPKPRSEATEIGVRCVAGLKEGEPLKRLVGRRRCITMFTLRSSHSETHLSPPSLIHILLRMTQEHTET